MSDDERALPPPESELDTEPTDETPRRVRRGPLYRLGCVLGVLVWLVLLLVPCMFITLAARGEITFDTGALPDQRFRMWLIMEARQRGIGIEWPSVHAVDEQECLQVDVRFLLWTGAAQEPVSYCQCYTRQGENWIATESIGDVCAMLRQSR
jgi:hypothetical protein